MLASLIFPTVLVWFVSRLSLNVTMMHFAVRRRAEKSRHDPRVAADYKRNVGIQEVKMWNCGRVTKTKASVAAVEIL